MFPRQERQHASLAGSAVDAADHAVDAEDSVHGLGPLIAPVLAAVGYDLLGRVQRSRRQLSLWVHLLVVEPEALAGIVLDLADRTPDEQMLQTVSGDMCYPDGAVDLGSADGLAPKRFKLDPLAQPSLDGLIGDAVGILMLGSYRQAVVEMLERQPSRGDWDDAVAGLREIERRIVGLQASHPEGDGLTKAWADRDAAITDLLSMQPPHLDGVLLLLDLVREVRFLRARTYWSRAKDIDDDGQVTIADIRAPGELGVARSLSLIAQHVARLRDLEMPRDWRGAMRDLGRIAPGAPDTVRNAFDQGMHLPELTNIQLGGLPDSQLPVLHFGERTVGPDRS